MVPTRRRCPPTRSSTDSTSRPRPAPRQRGSRPSPRSPARRDPRLDAPTPPRATATATVAVAAATAPAEDLAAARLVATSPDRPDRVCVAANAHAARDRRRHGHRRRRGRDLRCRTLCGRGRRGHRSGRSARPEPSRRHPTDVVVAPDSNAIGTTPPAGQPAGSGPAGQSRHRGRRRRWFGRRRHSPRSDTTAGRKSATLALARLSCSAAVGRGPPGRDADWSGSAELRRHVAVPWIQQVKRRGDEPTCGDSGGADPQPAGGAPDHAPFHPGAA